jgi:hypothetical protein
MSQQFTEISRSSAYDNLALTPYAKCKCHNTKGTNTNTVERHEGPPTQYSNQILHASTARQVVHPLNVPHMVAHGQVLAATLTQQPISGSAERFGFDPLADQIAPLLWDTRAYVVRINEYLGVTTRAIHIFLPNQPLHGGMATQHMPSPYQQSIPVPCFLCGQQGNNRQHCANQASALQPAVVLLRK